MVWACICVERDGLVAHTAQRESWSQLAWDARGAEPKCAQKVIRQVMAARTVKHIGPESTTASRSFSPQAVKRLKQRKCCSAGASYTPSLVILG